jgi:hypothetical protein
MSRSFKLPIGLRLATLLAVAIAACAGLYFSFGIIERMPPGDIWKWMSAQIIQAIVLFIWMECVPIVPTPDAAPDTINREPASVVDDARR